MCPNRKGDTLARGQGVDYLTVGFADPAVHDASRKTNQNGFELLYIKLRLGWH
jgi:hypothetical protein